METHAHHLHKAPGKNFWHYFFEFFMLFLAVTLGFFVENQREHYVEKQRAKEFASNLLFDFSNDTSRLRDLARYQDWKETSLDTLIILLNTPGEEYNASQFYQKLRSLDSWRITLNYSNTYDDLKSSGLMRYYTKNGLADKLKEYYDGYIALVNQEREAEKFHVEICEPFLDNHFDGRNYLNVVNGSPESNEFIFPLRSDKKIMLDDHVRKTLLNIVIRLKYKKGMFKNIEQYKRQKQMAIFLIELVKKEYQLE
jgi:hypothetical protein